MTVEEFLAAYSPEVRELALRTRGLVLDAIPGAIEKVETGHKLINYGSGDRMAEQICYIAPLKSTVNLGFFQGTRLPDPEGLLEGTGKLLRHVKIRRVEDVEKPGLRELIRAAVAATTYRRA
jgi:hypothetical protein